MNLMMKPSRRACCRSPASSYLEELISPGDFANIFPLMEGEALDELVDSIKKNGLRHKIVTYQGKIIDGRNRYIACTKAGYVLNGSHFTEWAGKEEGLLDFVVDENRNRRHLTVSQKAMVATRIASIVQGGDRKSEDFKAAKEALVSQHDAARMMGISRGSVQRAKIVTDRGIPEVVKAVEEGKMTVGKAYEVSKLPAEKQRKALRAEKADKILEKVKEMVGPEKAKPDTPDLVEDEMEVVTEAKVIVDVTKAKTRITISDGKQMRCIGVSILVILNYHGSTSSIIVTAGLLMIFDMSTSPLAGSIVMLIIFPSALKLKSTFSYTSSVAVLIPSLNAMYSVSVSRKYSIIGVHLLTLDPHVVISERNPALALIYSRRASSTIMEMFVLLFSA